MYFVTWRLTFRNKNPNDDDDGKANLKEKKINTHNTLNSYANANISFRENCIYYKQIAKYEESARQRERALEDNANDDDDRLSTGQWLK